MRRAALLTVLVLAAAVPLVAASCGSSAPTSAPAKKTGPPTYYGNVGSILNEHCAGCHTAGGVAPFRLDRERDAAKYARAVAAIVKTGLMPPWPPGDDSERFVGQDARRLDTGELAAIRAWAAAGAPAGKPRTLARAASASLPRGSRVRT